MSNIAEELRNLAFEARKENSTERLDRYAKARDEAFEIITDGVMDKIREAAKEGRFRFNAYDWVNHPRNSEEEVENERQVFFGLDEEGKNGLHIMALLNPTGIPYEQQLIFKLREFFNPTGEQEEQEQEQEQEQENGRRVHRLKVYLNRRPTNPRECSLVVSWDRRQPQFNGQQRFNGQQSFNGQEGVRRHVISQGQEGVRRHVISQGQGPRRNFQGQRGVPRPRQ